MAVGLFFVGRDVMLTSLCAISTNMGLPQPVLTAAE